MSLGVIARAKGVHLARVLKSSHSRCLVVSPPMVYVYDTYLARIHLVPVLWSRKAGIVTLVTVSRFVTVYVVQFDFIRRTRMRKIVDTNNPGPCCPYLR